MTLGTCRKGGWTAGWAVCFGLAAVPVARGQELPLHTLKLPEGFRIEVFTRDVPGARSMASGGRDTLFVGTRKEGKVYAVVDRDHDGRAERVYTIARGLVEPNGVAFRDGTLYIQEIDRLLRIDDIENRLDDIPAPTIVRRDFPRDRAHGWKFIAFGPDGLLYVPVGAPCNICIREDRRYASLLRMEPDGGNLEIFAEGIRNTVGFDWHPETKELWFTENGRDHLGDDFPPDELNRAPRAGLHFGYPWCVGNGQRDPEYGRGRDCSRYTPPVQELPAHVAALGMRFYTGTMFPESYRNQVFMAEHGSWNRSSAVGYRVSLVRLQGNKAAGYEPFATGWLRGRDGEQAWGRPVDVQVARDGALLVSDDKAGAVYRISYVLPAGTVRAR